MEAVSNFLLFYFSFDNRNTFSNYVILLQVYQVHNLHQTHKVVHLVLVEAAVAVAVAL